MVKNIQGDWPDKYKGKTLTELLGMVIDDASCNAEWEFQDKFFRQPVYSKAIAELANRKAQLEEIPFSQTELYILDDLRPLYTGIHKLESRDPNIPRIPSFNNDHPFLIGKLARLRGEKGADEILEVYPQMPGYPDPRDIAKKLLESDEEDTNLGTDDLSGDDNGGNGGDDLMPA